MNIPEHSTTYFKNGVKVYEFNSTGLFINLHFLFVYLVKKFKFDSLIYEFGSNWLSLNGEYKRENIILMKKFFYDEYPLVKRVSFSKGTIRIEFLTDVTFVSRHSKINEYEDCS